MDQERLQREIARLCEEVRADSITDFLERTSEAYRERYTAATMAQHLRMIALLSRATPVALDVLESQRGSVTITVVSHDYFGELSILCGLLSSFELTILSGDVHTFERAAARPATIVDVFQVRPVGKAVFDEQRRSMFKRALAELYRLLAEGRYVDARDRVNLRLVEMLDAQRVSLDGVLYPVDVLFDVVATPRWTVMDVHAQDTPAFLYSLANALSMRNVYIHRVEIESVGDQVRDRFYIADRHGRKIEAAGERAALRLAVGLIKQFTYHLPAAPDPISALRHFDQLLDRILASDGDRDSTVASLEQGLADLAQILGSSRFVWEDFLRMQLENLLPALESLRTRSMPRGRERFVERLEASLAGAATFDDKRRVLNEFKDREMLAIDFHHLLDPNVLSGEFGAALTELAEAVIEQACRVCDEDLRQAHGRPQLEGGAPCPFAVLGLGKLGGQELGYASDIELLFVFGGAGRTDGGKVIENATYFDCLVRMVLGFIEAHRDGIFEIDLRLRPFGGKGPLASPLDQFAAYYREGGDAAPFERQALVKLRAVAGDPQLGRRVESLRDAFVYSGAAWDLDQARHLRWRQMSELARAGERDVKHGPGGMIDIEYGVQYLQILHGHERAELRAPNTLVAIDRLAAAGIISQEEGEKLAQSYGCVRRVINALRMVRGNARDLVLPAADSKEFQFLARRLGYRGATWDEASARLQQDLDLHMRLAHEFYVRRFGDPAPRADDGPRAP